MVNETVEYLNTTFGGSSLCISVLVGLVWSVFTRGAVHVVGAADTVGAGRRGNAAFEAAAIGTFAVGVIVGAAATVDIIGGAKLGG